MLVLDAAIDEGAEVEHGAVEVYDPILGVGVVSLPRERLLIYLDFRQIIATTVVKPLVQEYNQLRRGPQTYWSQSQMTSKRSAIDRIIAKLRKAAGASDQFPYFGERCRCLFGIRLLTSPQAQQARDIEEMLES